MRISRVKYCNTFFPKQDLTRILGIPTYNDLHQIKLELKTNALSIHSNFGGATHGNLGLLMMNTKYAILSKIPHLRPVHPGIIIIPRKFTRVASYEIKQVYDDNLRVFHEVCGVKHDPIQQVITTVDEQYIISTKIRITDQFTGNIHQLFVYLLATQGKLSRIHAVYQVAFILLEVAP